MGAFFYDTFRPEDRFWEYANMELLWSFAPRRCTASGKWLFFCLAYRARRIITGPGEPVVEDYWYSKGEGLIQMLKGNK